MTIISEWICFGGYLDKGLTDTGYLQFAAAFYGELAILRKKWTMLVWRMMISNFAEKV